MKCYLGFCKKLYEVKLKSLLSPSMCAVTILLTLPKYQYVFSFIVIRSFIKYFKLIATTQQTKLNVERPNLK